MLRAIKRFFFLKLLYEAKMRYEEQPSSDQEFVVRFFRYKAFQHRKKTKQG